MNEMEAAFNVWRDKHRGSLDSLMDAFMAGYQVARQWTRVESEADLHQPQGLYWTTFVDEGKHCVGSDRIYLDDQTFSRNTIAYMRIDEPEPWRER